MRTGQLSAHTADRAHTSIARSALANNCTGQLQAGNVDKRALCSAHPMASGAASPASRDTDSPISGMTVYCSPAPSTTSRGRASTSAKSCSMQCFELLSKWIWGWPVVMSGI
jgi:hypothetical protein